MIAAAEDAEAAPAEAAKPVEGPTNVFGEALQGCTEDGKGDACEYPTQLCVRVGKLTMRYECKSIWEADWKSFKSPGGKIKKTQPPEAGDTTKCEAVPSEVLDSQYSKDNWNSLEGSSALPTVLKSGGKKGVRLSDKAQRFRKSIDFVCETCALYAPDFGADAGATLAKKCAALGWKSGVSTETAEAPTFI
jgi:hypothetical protein